MNRNNEQNNQSQASFNEYSPKNTIKSSFLKIRRLLLTAPGCAEEESEEVKHRIMKRGSYVCMIFLLGFLLANARLPFGAYPLGFALVGCASSHVITAALGMITSIAVFKLPISHLFALFVLIAVRILGRVFLDRPEKPIRENPLEFIRYSLFTENIYLRLSAISVAVFAVGLWNIIINSFRYYDLWGALLSMIAAPALAYVFSLFFDSDSSAHEKISIASLLVCAVYSIYNASDIGRFIAVCVSQVSLLSMLRRMPPIYPLAMSVALGIVCDPLYAPMFLFSSLAYVLVRRLTKQGDSPAVVTCLVSSAAWALITDGKSAMYTVVPAMLASAALDNLIRAIVPSALPSEEYASIKMRQSVLTDSESEKRLAKLSASFSKLSQAFKRLSDRLSHPGVFEIRKECDEVLDKYCNECKNNSICWGEDYSSTIGFLNEISTHLNKNGKIDDSFVPEGMAERCNDIDSIISDINAKTKELYRDSLEKEKLTVFSSDYSSLSKIINDSIYEKQLESSENKELTEKALEAMGSYKNDFHTVSVWGKRKLRVFARLKTVNENTVGMREFKRLMERVCNCSFANPILKIEGKSMTINLNIRPVFAVEAAKARQSADNVSMCGDSPSFFDGHDDYFYALISDGMGTGSNAALTSGICEIFLREMLEGGNRVDTALSMLNSVIVSKGNECSATVDILELDLFSGVGNFVKSGAASSFILRDGNVYRLSARTMPLGILDELDTDIQQVSFCDGDTVFLVSDGAAPMENYDELISIIKCSSPSEDLNVVCERIIANAKKHSKDDVSCIAIRIKRL